MSIESSFFLEEGVQDYSWTYNNGICDWENQIITNHGIWDYESSAVEGSYTDKIHHDFFPIFQNIIVSLTRKKWEILQMNYEFFQALMCVY